MILFSKFKNGTRKVYVMCRTFDRARVDWDSINSLIFLAERIERLDDSSFKTVVFALRVFYIENSTNISLICTTRESD